MDIYTILNNIRAPRLAHVYAQHAHANTSCPLHEHAHTSNNGKAVVVLPDRCRSHQLFIFTKGSGTGSSIALLASSSASRNTPALH